VCRGVCRGLVYLSVSCGHGGHLRCLKGWAVKRVVISFFFLFFFNSSILIPNQTLCPRKFQSACTENTSVIALMVAEEVGIKFSYRIKVCANT
jgi:hypothetical protein